MRTHSLALFLVMSPAAALAGPDPVCGPHEHLVVERDEDEGSIVKRCLCDEGYHAEGPGKPCKPIKAEETRKPAKPGARK